MPVVLSYAPSVVLDFSTLLSASAIAPALRPAAQGRCACSSISTISRICAEAFDIGNIRAGAARLQIRRMRKQVGRRAACAEEKEARMGTSEARIKVGV